MDTEYKTTDDIFTCQLCGQCCKGFGGTYVTGRDIADICTYIKADPDTFVTSYCSMAGSRPVLTQRADGYCIFFDPEEQCTIHPVKPRMCREWPFLETLVTNPENWDAMASACPGMKTPVLFSELIHVVSQERKKQTIQSAEAGSGIKSPGPA